MASIQLLLVEDDPDWHAGLSDYFRHDPDIELAACVSSVADALEMLRSQPMPGVIKAAMQRDRLHAM